MFSPKATKLNIIDTHTRCVDQAFEIVEKIIQQKIPQIDCGH